MTEKKYTGPAIPTGYEGIVSDIAQKRKVAEALTAAGLQGPGAGARSYAQLLGSLAQTWVGGNLEKKATQAETELNQKRLADRAAALVPFQEALQSGDSAKLSGFLGNQNLGPEQDVISDIVSTLANNRNTVSGDPTRMTGPDGKVTTTIMDKSGGVKTLPGGYQALPKVTNVNDVAVALDETKPGTVLPQNLENLVIRGQGGAPEVNRPLLGAKTQIAGAGRPTTTTILNTTEQKSFGKEVPEAYTKELEGLRKAATDGQANLPVVTAARKNLREGVYSGFGASAKLMSAKALDAVGLANPEQKKYIAASENFVRNTGNLIFPILAALRPASDTDVLTAKAMMGGDLGLSKQAMDDAMAAYEQSVTNSERRLNQRTRELQGLYSDSPDIAQRLGGFSTAPSPAPAAAPGSNPRAAAAAAELARRRGGR